MWNAKEAFREHAKEANSVADFLNKYYRGDRYIGRGKEYADVLLAHYEQDFKNDGFVWISKHDSTTGQIASFYKANYKQKELL